MALRRLLPGSGIIPVRYHKGKFMDLRDMDSLRINDRQKNNDPIHITADDRECKCAVIKLLSEIDNE